MTSLLQRWRDTRKGFKPRDVEEPIDYHYHRPLAGLLVQLLEPTAMTPNQVTLLSGLFSVLSGLALGASLLGLTLGSPWGDAALAMSFICFMAMGDQRDLMNYIRGVLLVWLGIGLMSRYGPLPPIELNLVFLFAQIVVFAGLAIWRFFRAQADGEPRHEYLG